MRCVHCETLQNLPGNKVSFRAVCEKCGRDLHSCKNCKYYSPGKPNDCLVPGTDYIKDREAYNFCEEFAPLEKLPSSPKKTKSSFDDLFK